MRKLKPTEVACLAQGHGAAKYLRGFDAGSLTQVPTHAIWGQAFPTLLRGAPALSSLFPWKGPWPSLKAGSQSYLSIFTLDTTSLLGPRSVVESHFWCLPPFPTGPQGPAAPLPDYFWSHPLYLPSILLGLLQLALKSLLSLRSHPSFPSALWMGLNHMKTTPRSWHR